MRPINPKYVWWLVLLLLGVGTYFGIPIPTDWSATSIWVLSFDEWVVNRATYPGLFLVVIGLLVGTVLAPEALRLARAYLRNAEGRAKVTIADVGVVPSGLGPLDAIWISFAIANPGPPSTFHDWELWATPANSKSVGVKLEGSLGLGDDDLRTRPLETGGRRIGKLEIVHYALNVTEICTPGTLITIRVKDVREREIQARYLIPSASEQSQGRSNVLSSAK